MRKIFSVRLYFKEYFLNRTKIVLFDWYSENGEVAILMTAVERRVALLKLICRRRFETVSNLAAEFGVSERTIRRDINVLMQTESIYTQQGRYGGGVYVVDTYTIDRMYFNDDELYILTKMLDCVTNSCVCQLSQREKDIMKKFIADYTKPRR